MSAFPSDKRRSSVSLRAGLFARIATVVIALVAGFAVSAMPAGAGPAAPSVVLGGGSGIYVGEGLCTLGAIGYDAGGRLVGLTAGHCGDVGAPVQAEADTGTGTVGTLARVNKFLDYAVIAFEPDEVVPVATIGDTTITDIGGPARFPDIACKHGRSTGRTCGVVYGELMGVADFTWTQVCVLPGDSGGPVVVGTTLIGLVTGYVQIPCLAPETGPSVAAIVRDSNADGGIGAGFRPV